MIVIYCAVVYSRHINWVIKAPLFATYGFWGIIGMDWLGLLAVVIFNAIIAVIIVEIMMQRIKRIPISLGVLQ